MEASMSKPQRIVVLLGAVCVLHSSMVPPVMQAGDYVCRYHEFVERHWPFTRGYEVADADLSALFSEYGMIVATGVIVYSLLGFKTPS